MSSAPATALSVAPAFDIIVELKSAFAEYESVEKKGLAFGQRLYPFTNGICRPRTHFIARVLRCMRHPTVCLRLCEHPKTRSSVLVCVLWGWRKLQ